MAASSVPCSWIPEDDLLLKNAVEAGASLEALAKGAVQFSRKFTVWELRERWHSLLYDPDVSAEASAGMVQFELFGSKLSKTIGSKENDGISAKRKVGSVRRLYYARKKKTCARSLKATPGVGFLGSTDANGCIGIGSVCGENVAFEDQSLGANCVFGGHDQDPFGSGRAECCYELPEFEDKGHGGKKDIGSHDLNVNRITSTEMNAVESGAILPDKCNVDGLNSSSTISECDFVDLPESLLNFSNEDELPFMDTDKKELVDKSSDDDRNLLLVTSPNEAHDDPANVKEAPILVSGTSLGLDRTCPPDLEVTEESQSSDRVMNPPQFTSAPNTWLPEHGDREMECVLNTEDPEIPSNDIVFTTKEFAASVEVTTSKGASFLSSSCTNQKDDKKRLGLMNKEGNPAQSLTVSKMVGHDVLPQSTPKPPIIAHREPSQRISVMATQTPGSLRTVEPLCAYHSTDIPRHTKSSFPEKAISVPERDTLMLCENEEGSESDEDVPCFSDIEAMILEMDLCQDHPDSANNREVSSYQSEDAKRTIIRLEQCARSSMQRAIASRGALAILYGRHLKHYIKETEVILGRATDDMDVDIDLGREGPANKISRRQALITMGGDGSFHLKNLGKSPIFLNGAEVANGASSRLSSNSLIEIRGMAFVFEVSSESVRQYLANAAKNRPGSN